MSRVKGGVTSHARHRKVVKQAKGYYGARSTNFRTAKQAVDRQYRATMERTRKDAAETQVDPWANLRGPAPDAAKKKN